MTIHKFGSVNCYVNSKPNLESQYAFLMLLFLGFLYAAVILGLSPELHTPSQLVDIFVLLLGHVRVFLLKFKHAVRDVYQKYCDLSNG